MPANLTPGASRRYSIGAICAGVNSAFHSSGNRWTQPL
jgi:hypothetical protein